MVRPAGAGRHAAGDHRQVHAETVSGAGDAGRAQARSRISGLEVIGGTPAEFAAVIRTEQPYWAKIIKEAGIKATE